MSTRNTVKHEGKSLTDSAIKAFKTPPVGEAYRKADGPNARGLGLLVMPTGGKLWRFRYQFEGKEKEISFGAYPDVPLALARERREAARKLVAAGTDPSAERKARKADRDVTFEVVAEELIDGMTNAPGTRKLFRARFVKWIYPVIGRRPIRALTTPDLLAPIKACEANGTKSTAHRVRSQVGRVLRFAEANGYVGYDISRSLKGALSPYKGGEFAACYDPRRLGVMLNTMACYQGQPITKVALELTPLLMLRSTELRGGRWEEIDFDADVSLPTGGTMKCAIWRIPKTRTKARSQPLQSDHLVPLPTQAVALLRRLQSFSGPEGLLFPQLFYHDRCMSGNTINACLQSLGIDTKTEQTNHGFRKTASTLLNELNLNSQAIELQLYHKIGGMKGKYDKALKLPERAAVLQRWADYLDSLRAAATSRAATTAKQ